MDTLQLDRYQAARVQRVREVPSQEHGTDLHSLAGRIGRLEWHVGDLLALIDGLAGSEQE